MESTKTHSNLCIFHRFTSTKTEMVCIGLPLCKRERERERARYTFILCCICIVSFHTNNNCYSPQLRFDAVHRKKKLCNLITLHTCYHSFGYSFGCILFKYFFSHFLFDQSNSIEASHLMSNVLTNKKRNLLIEIFSLVILQ